MHQSQYVDIFMFLLALLPFFNFSVVRFAACRSLLIHYFCLFVSFACSLVVSVVMSVGWFTEKCSVFCVRDVALR